MTAPPERLARRVRDQDNASLWEFYIEGRLIDMTWVRHEIEEAIRADERERSTARA